MRQHGQNGAITALFLGLAVAVLVLAAWLVLIRHPRYSSNPAAPFSGAVDRAHATARAANDSGRRVQDLVNGVTSRTSVSSP